MTIDKSYYEVADGQLENIIYGDTDSIFLHVENYAIKLCKDKFNKDFNSLNMDEAIELINGIIEYVSVKINDTYISEFSSVFGIKPKHNKMKFKTEMLCSVTYFLNVKKKYALKVVSKEGVRVNEYELKGLETRRSDYAEFSKKLVGDVIYNYILEKKSLSEIVQFVGEKKLEAIELIEKGSPAISTPKTFAKEMDDYKKLPGHIAAMLFYNELVGKEEFRSGSKGYLFYIKGIQSSLAPSDVLKRFENYKGPKKAVVVPFGKTLPEYLIPDTDTMLDNVYTARLSNLLKPLDIVINSGNIEENLQMEF